MPSSSSQQHLWNEEHRNLLKSPGERFAVLALERKMKHRSLTFDGKTHDTEDFWVALEKKK